MARNIQFREGKWMPENHSEQDQACLHGTHIWNNIGIAKTIGSVAANIESALNLDLDA